MIKLRLCLIVLVTLCAVESRSQNSWSTGANMPTLKRVSSVGFTIGSKGYVGLGSDENTGSLGDMWEYDPVLNQWTQKDNFPGGGRYGAAAFVIGSKAYVGIGQSTAEFYEFDPSKSTGQQWTQKANYPGAELGSLTAISIGNYGYAGLGETNFQQWWRYDPVNNQWTQRADYPGLTHVSIGGFSIGTKGYIVDLGGSSFDSVPYLMEYDPDNNTWTAKATFTQKRNNAVVFVIGGRGYFGGGSSPNAPGQSFRDFYEYDPIEDVVVRKADIAGLIREASYNFSLNGRGYTGGGYDFFNGYFNDLRIYTPEAIYCSVPIRSKCQGETMAVNYEVPYSTLNAGNTIKVELSDANGAFTSPVEIGSITTTNKSGVVNATIPMNTPGGTGYRVRVKSSNTALTSVANHSNITINVLVTPTINLTADPGSSIVLGTDVTITANTTHPGANPQYAWTRNGSPVGLNQQTLEYADYLEGDIIKCTLTSNAICRTSNTANSNTITLNVSPNRPGDTWERKADLGGGGRNAASAFTIGAKAYVGLGVGTTYKNDMWEYDPGSDTWTQKANAPHDLAYAATWVLNDIAYFAAGFRGVFDKTTFAFDPIANTWSQKLDFPGPARFIHFSFTANGKGYVGGGRETNGNSAVLKDLWEFNPQTNVWVQKADAPVPRVQSFAFSIDGKGYVGGGGNQVSGGQGLDFLRDLVEYNPATNTWVQKADHPGANIYYGTATSVDGKGYVNANNGTGNFLEYDPVSDTWSFKTNSPVDRIGTAMFAIGSRVYVAGGAGPSAELWRYTTDMMSIGAMTQACPGDVRDVKWSTRKFISFVPGNTFTVQLSNDAGSFSSPSTIGTINSSAATGSVQVTFPTQLTPGGTYRMRIVASNPGYASSSSTLAIPLSARPATTVSIASDIGTTVYSSSFPYLNAAVTNGGNFPTYVWKRNGTVVQGVTTNQLGVYPLAAGDSFTCEVTANLACALPVTSNAIVFNIVSGPPTITTTPVTANYCQGAPISVGYTATGLIFTASTVLEAQISSKTGSFTVPRVIGTLTTAALTGQVAATIPTDLEPGAYRVRVMLATGFNSSVDSGLGLTVSSSLPALAIAQNPDNAVCAGLPVTFTATAPSEGVTPDYQWKVNTTDVGTNSSTFVTSTLKNGDVVYCTMTSKSGCAANPVVTGFRNMFVNPSFTPAVAIAADKPLTGCIGESVTFTATTSNAGTQPTYEWMMGSTVVGTTASITIQPQPGLLTCKVTPVSFCTTTATVISDPVILSPREKPVVPTISLSSDGTKLNASPDNATNVYEWYRNNVKLSATTASLSLSDAGVYKVQAGVFGSACLSGFSPDFTVVITGDIASPDIGFTFYPNPTEDRLTVRMAPGRKAIVVYQMTGRVTTELSTTRESEDIDVRNYTPGVYLVRITSADGAFIGKFLKK